MKFGYKAKITLTTQQEGDAFFGPGVQQLLKGIEKSGSLQSACKEMHMAYSKGWRILKTAEGVLGLSLVSATKGGASGGKTELTEHGTRFCEQYESFCGEINSAAHAAFLKYFGR